MDTAEAIGWQAGTAARAVARSRALRRLARIGLVCRAVLYALIGVLALRIATGSGGREADKTGAVESVAGQPFGVTLLGLMAVGFAAMALWQASVAGSGGRGRAERIEAAIRTALYVLILGSILSVLLWGHGESGDQQARDVTANLFDLPAGQALVALVGLAVVALGGYWIYQGITRTFLEDLWLARMSVRARSVATRLGTAGYLARGVVAGLAGGFAVRATVGYQPGQAKGIDATLRALAESPGGPWLLTAVALGLVTFAGYGVCEALWRRV
ncbi:MAG TPA: DUF1206 domain-containing protein [Micromonosporaceae bacterium]